MSIYRSSYQNEKFTVRLRIWGYSNDLSELDNMLGVKHEIALKKGDRKKPGAAPVKTSYWAYLLDDDSDSLPEDKVSKLLHIFKDKTDIIHTISENCKVTVSVTQTTYTYNPEYDFPPQILEQVSSLGATLWLDIYSLPFTYLEEQQQKDNLIHALKASKAANKHGIKTDQDRNNLVDLLANIETLKDDIFTDMFPHYAGDEPATEEDIEKALLTTRERIKDLYQLTEKSTFFSGK